MRQLSSVQPAAIASSTVAIEVLIKVRMYKEQIRSGQFQKELEEVEMSLTQFKIHFMRCMQKYLKHHFNDIMSSQARRNLYEKMKTDKNLSTTLILASDYSAILDGHSQDQLNQTTQLHSIQLVILTMFLLRKHTLSGLNKEHQN